MPTAPISAASARPGPQLASAPPTASSRPDLDNLMYAGTPAAVSAVTSFADASVYQLDSGDRLRIVVFGQDGLSNSYAVDAAGNITMPLIGAVPARGVSTAQLAREVAARLRNGFIREPHVAIEIENYRPFFILGEVTYPGQYPFVPNMTVQTAVAIAGGFTPRAYRWRAQLTRSQGGQTYSTEVPPTYALRPGDTVSIDERWF
ncbi:MAG TPA: polysaccharide biosynthesis/export family protein [Xanthobacteraceae bacterium]|nr:polysaccharide biosynthesis/export family protein [Xanthobacteraceae bacterium]